MKEYLFMENPFEDVGSTPIDFTDPAVFSGASSINGGTVEISSERGKLREKSLKWSYEKGSMLRICGINEMEDLNTFPGPQGIKLWIYSPEKVDENIIIRIGKSKLVSCAPLYRFTVNMNFEGWRAVWIRLNVSAKTIHTQLLMGVDTIEFEAPHSKAGVMWIDAFEVLESAPYTFAADFQMPHLPLWSAGYHLAAYNRTPLTADCECTEEHKKAFELIMKRIDEYILPSDIDFASLEDDNPLKIRYDGLNDLIKEEVEKYDSWNIKRGEDGKVYGPGLFAILDEGKDKKRFVSFEKIWAALALDWKVNKNKDSLEKVIDLFDYFYDQGWAEGSSCGAMMLEEMRIDGYVYAFYILRDELKERGIYERELGNIRWRSEFGYIFSYADEDITSVLIPTCDKMRSINFFMLIYILGLEDSPLKVFYMKKYLEFFKYFTAPKPGIDHGIKADGTLWHHLAPYMIAYGAEALNYFTLIRYTLHGTCFEVDDESVNNIKKILDVYKVTAYKNDITTTRISGRFPGMKCSMFGLLSSYALTALCGDEECARMFKTILDENQAALGNFYKGRLPSIAWMETYGQPKIFEMALECAKNTDITIERDGFYKFPYGGYCIFRKKDFLFTASGWSSYLWDFENGVYENVYGRYYNYGSAILTTDGRNFDSQLGIDWSNIPGTTAKHLSHDELMVRNWLDCRYHSDETFLGGVALEGGNGIYALCMHDMTFDPTLRAKKSWFCFGNMIIALGSGIENEDKDHPTETTLFQTIIMDGDKACVNSQIISDFDYEGKKGECVWLADTCKNGYIVPDAEGLKLKRNRQGLKYHTSKDAEGATAVAYIDHGMAPENAGYEYVILPNYNEDIIKAEAKNPSYRVLKRDENAHIIEVGNVIGYVIYNENEEFSCGVVNKTNTPCVIGETKLSDKETVINISDPDLRLCDFPQGSDNMHDLKLTLSGEWDAVSDDEIVSKISSGVTVISIGTKDGKETEIKLTLRK